MLSINFSQQYFDTGSRSCHVERSDSAEYSWIGHSDRHAESSHMMFSIRQPVICGQSSTYTLQLLWRTCDLMFTYFHTYSLKKLDHRPKTSREADHSDFGSLTLIVPL